MLLEEQICIPTLSQKLQIAVVFIPQKLVPAPVPANDGHASVMGSEMIDLGLVIKSFQVVHLINAYLSTWKV